MDKNKKKNNIITNMFNIALCGTWSSLTLLVIYFIIWKLT